jgi:hypothetical protein
MGEPRTFSICQGCGAWRETKADLISFLNDYDMIYFVEHHAARCPVTGQPATIATVRENDPDFQPLPPEKMWRPENYSGYKPQREPSFSPYTTDISIRLVGIWEPSDLLRVYDRGREEDPREFFKSDEPIKSYTPPRAEGS